MVGGFNQCDFLAVKLSVKMAAWPDALANCAHFPPGWLIPVKGPTFPDVKGVCSIPYQLSFHINYYEGDCFIATLWIRFDQKMETCFYY